MKNIQPSEAGQREKQVIAKQVKEIISDLAGIKSHRLKLTINLRKELGIDSFTSLEIIVAIEKAFGTSVAEKQIARLITLQDVIDYVFENQKPMRRAK